MEDRPARRQPAEREIHSLENEERLPAKKTEHPQHKQVSISPDGMIARQRNEEDDKREEEERVDQPRRTQLHRLPAIKSAMFQSV